MNTTRRHPKLPAPRHLGIRHRAGHHPRRRTRYGVRRRRLRRGGAARAGDARRLRGDCAPRRAFLRARLAGLQMRKEDREPIAPLARSTTGSTPRPGWVARTSASAASGGRRPGSRVDLGIGFFVDDRIDVLTTMANLVPHRFLFGASASADPGIVAAPDWSVAEAADRRDRRGARRYGTSMNVGGTLSVSQTPLSER